MNATQGVDNVLLTNTTGNEGRHMLVGLLRMRSETCFTINEDDLVTN